MVLQRNMRCMSAACFKTSRHKCNKIKQFYQIKGKCMIFLHFRILKNNKHSPQRLWQKLIKNKFQNNWPLFSFISMVGCRNIWLQTHFDKHAIVTFNRQILPWLTLGRNLNLQLNTQISVDATNTCILLPGTGWLQKCGTPGFCRQMVWTCLNNML